MRSRRNGAPIECRARVGLIVTNPGLLRLVTFW